MLIGSFALSITPKKILHNWIADHQDRVPVAVQDLGSKTVAMAGYHCNVDSLVVESPFQLFAYTSPQNESILFGLVIVEPLASFFSLHHFYSELRGPPSVAA